MRTRKKIISILAISAFLLVQIQDALAETVTISEQADNQTCRQDRSCFLP